MGMYDTVIVNCPGCGAENDFQSKSGDCFLGIFKLHECPNDVLQNVNRHSPCRCECGVYMEVDIKQRKGVFAHKYED